MPEKKTRLAMRIAYDGDVIEGWQRQPGKRTVQGLLEEALRSLELRGKLQGASRTDAGVHALAQVAHLDVPMDSGRALREIQRRLNLALPEDVRLHSLVPAPRRFNARWSSRGKVYNYLLATPDDMEAAAEDALLRLRAWILPDPRAFPDLAGRAARLDTNAMRTALESLLGTRDYRGLATTRDPRVSRKKTTRRLGAGRIVSSPYPGAAGGELHCITVAGDAFLKHMVRNLAGLLAQTGYGELHPHDVSGLVAGRRRHEGPRAPGRGLTLCRVRYPAHVTPAWNG